MIAGNHDFFFDTEASRRNPHPHSASEIDQFLTQYSSIIYLNNSGITIEGIKIWGSPISKWFYDWAFNRHEGEEIRRYWDLIPKDTDILLTHGPARGIHDMVGSGHEGDRDLLEAVERIKPGIFACGHIHEGYGEKRVGGTLHINSSSVDNLYRTVNPPIILFTEELL